MVWAPRVALLPIGPDNVIILVENTLFREIFSKLDSFNYLSKITENSNFIFNLYKCDYLTFALWEKKNHC